LHNALFNERKSLAENNLENVCKTFRTTKILVRACKSCSRMGRSCKLKIVFLPICKYLKSQASSVYVSLIARVFIKRRIRLHLNYAAITQVKFGRLPRRE